MWPSGPRCHREIALKPVEPFPPPHRGLIALQWGVVVGSLALLLAPAWRTVLLRGALGTAIVGLWAISLFTMARCGDLKLTLPQVYRQFREGRRRPEPVSGTLANTLSILAWFVVVT